MIYEKLIKDKFEIKILPLIPEYLKDCEKDNYLSWFNDPEINKYNSHAVLPCTEIKEIKSDEIVWKICFSDRTSRVAYIGNIGLHNIDLINRSAEIAILIGEKGYHGKGIGIEVIKMVMNHGFVKMGLNRLYLGTAASNDSMREIAKKLGMKLEGARRQAIWINGYYDDVAEYGILKHEYEDNIDKDKELESINKKRIANGLEPLPENKI